jgi:flagellar biosynthesis regulator FlaF
MAWDDEGKARVIAAYKAAGPTPENSTEIIKDIAEEENQSPNGVRMILVQAGVYVKKETASGTTKKEGDAPKRVSKEAQIDALRKAIEGKGANVDEEILSKLTGKAAAYFLEVLQTK